MDDTDRDAIVLALIPFLHRLALKLVRPMDKDDLVQEAVYRILEKFDRYDPSRGVKPLTYFGVIGYRAMSDYLRRNRVVAVPRHPNEMEKFTRGSVSLERTIGSSGMFLKDELVCHRTKEAGSEEFSEQDAANLPKCIELLEPRLKALVTLLLDGVSMAEVGRRLGVSKQRIWQLRRAACKKLRIMLDNVAT